MSGEGAGIIMGILGIAAFGTVIAAIGAVILAGGAIYLAGRAAIGAGKGIYAAHKAAEERRLAKARAELEAVTGALKETALERHEEMKKAEASLAAAYEHEVERREKMMEEAHSKVVKAERRMEDLVLELPKFYETRERDIRDAIDREISSFTRDLEKACDDIAAQATASMTEKKRESLARLDAAFADIEARKQAHLDYAMDVKLSAESLLKALQKSYEIEKYASAEYAAVQTAAEQLAELMKDPNEAKAKSAANSAAMLAERVQILQVRLEQRTATFNHQKKMLEARLAELKGIAEATHDLKADDKEGILDPYVSEECDAAFWSEGRLTKLWDKAKELEEKVKEFQYTTSRVGQESDAALLAFELDNTRMALEREHARVRALLMSKVFISKIAGDMIESMTEMGWELAEEPFYHKNAAGEEDERMPIELKFERDGDKMSVILYDEYDEKTGQYRQGVRRLSNEAGMADEKKRHEEDAQVTEKMRKRGHKDFTMTCKKSTEGKKMISEE